MLRRFTAGWLAYVSACADQTASQDAARARALYPQVEAIVTQACARDVCHGFMVANARLDLVREGLLAALVDVPACEYDRMMRVKPGAPNNSWIMVKLAGTTRFRDYADFIEFEPDPDWQPQIAECSSTFEDGSPWFGTPMPPPDTTEVRPQDIALIREWIALGALGPSDAED